MSLYTDEHEADAEVIRVLQAEINNLRSINNMAEIIVGQDGKVYRVHHAEELSAEEVAEITATLEHELEVLKGIQQPTQTEQVVEQPAVDPTPVDGVPTPQVVPAPQPEAPAAPAVEQTVPANGVVPVDQPVNDTPTPPADQFPPQQIVIQ